MVEKCSVLKERVTLPLIETESSSFRLYLSDTGMFSYESGIFYENHVADELTAAGIPLYYWKGENNAEFEMKYFSYVRI